MESTLILYTRPGCPFSAKVLLEAAVLGIDLTELSTRDPEVLKELIEKGGKEQTPYLVDMKNNVSLYESDAIMEHLHQYFGAKA